VRGWTYSKSEAQEEQCLCEQSHRREEQKVEKPFGVFWVDKAQEGQRFYNADETRRNRARKRKSRRPRPSILRKSSKSGRSVKLRRRERKEDGSEPSDLAPDTRQPLDQAKAHGV
jgi:hypothetical protein